MNNVKSKDPKYIQRVINNRKHIEELIDKRKKCGEVVLGKTPYVQMFKPLIYDSGLNKNELQVLSEIYDCMKISHGNPKFYDKEEKDYYVKTSWDRIKKYMPKGISRQTVGNSIQTLRAAGYIKTKRVYNGPLIIFTPYFKISDTNDNIQNDVNIYDKHSPYKDHVLICNGSKFYILTPSKNHVSKNHISYDYVIDVGKVSIKNYYTKNNNNNDNDSTKTGNNKLGNKNNSSENNTNDNQHQKSTKLKNNKLEKDNNSNHLKTKYIRNSIITKKFNGANQSLADLRYQYVRKSGLPLEAFNRFEKWAVRKHPNDEIEQKNMLIILCAYVFICKKNVVSEVNDKSKVKIKIRLEKHSDLRDRIISKSNSILETTLVGKVDKYNKPIRNAKSYIYKSFYKIFEEYINDKHNNSDTNKGNQSNKKNPNNNHGHIKEHLPDWAQKGYKPPKTFSKDEQAKRDVEVNARKAKLKKTENEKFGEEDDNDD